MARGIRLMVTLGAMALASCGNGENPCSQCPAVAGTYRVVYDDNSGSASADCATLGVGDPPGPLDLTQSGSSLQAQMAGFSLVGTLFDSFNLNLNGNRTSADAGETDTLSLHAQFVPATADAGAWITGNATLIEDVPTPQGTQNCTLSRSFTAFAQ